MFTGLAVKRDASQGSIGLRESESEMKQLSGEGRPPVQQKHHTKWGDWDQRVCGLNLCGAVQC